MRASGRLPSPSSLQRGLHASHQAAGDRHLGQPGDDRAARAIPEERHQDKDHDDRHQASEHQADPGHNAACERRREEGDQDQADDVEQAGDDHGAGAQADRRAQARSDQPDEGAVAGRAGQQQTDAPARQADRHQGAGRRHPLATEEDVVAPGTRTHEAERRHGGHQQQARMDSAQRFPQLRGSDGAQNKEQQHSRHDHAARRAPEAHRHRGPR